MYLGYPFPHGQSELVIQVIQFYSVILLRTFFFCFVFLVGRGVVTGIISFFLFIEMFRYRRNETSTNHEI